jgi:uncharacterized protein YbaP (TraB family)
MTRRRLRARAFVAVALALLSALAAQTHAATKSFVWKATGPRGGTVYLAGSVHLLSAAYYPLAPAFDTAFRSADLLVEEIDLLEMSSPDAQLELLTRGMLPSGQSLEQVVAPETYRAVGRKVATLGLPIEPLKRLKPWSLALMLQGMEWQKAGFNPDLGLDKHFYDAALAANKKVQGLETLAFQIAQFDQMPMPLQDKLLAETLKELDTTQTAVAQLADSWKAGDAAAVEAIVLDDLKSEPDIYQRLLVDRNRSWLPKIEALFSRPAPAFVVVGAAHLVGSDGILAALKAKGYTVEQL